MDKKAKIGDIMMDNVIYLILLIIFFAGMFAFVNSKMGGASFWEDYYAKEITRVVDSSMPGDIIYMDVQRATEIAQGNKITNPKIASPSKTICSEVNSALLSSPFLPIQNQRVLSS